MVNQSNTKLTGIRRAWKSIRYKLEKEIAILRMGAHETADLVDVKIDLAH